MHEQFNSLLDLSKFDTSVIIADHTEFRLDVLLKNIVDGVMPEAHARKIELHLFVASVMIRSDMLLLYRLFRNLIINAVRYTDKDSVSVQARRQSIVLATGNVSSARLNEIRAAEFNVLVKLVDYYTLRQAPQAAMKTPLSSVSAI